MMRYVGVGPVGKKCIWYSLCGDYSLLFRTQSTTCLYVTTISALGFVPYVQLEFLLPSPLRAQKVWDVYYTEIFQQTFAWATSLRVYIPQGLRSGCMFPSPLCVRVYVGT